LSGSTRKRAQCRSTMRDFLGDPELVKALPPEVREAFLNIKLDLRFDMESVLAKPFRQVSLLEQLALAACDTADAAYALYLLAWEAHDHLFARIDSGGKEKILRWVAASYFPSGELPEGLWEHLALYLEPEPSGNEGPPPSAPEPPTTRS
jgi:hypothetical protein